MAFMDDRSSDGALFSFLDLFCGAGTASRGFAELGFRCTGVDNVNRGYPYNFIKADLEDYIPPGRFTVIWASTPCTEFSIAKKYAWGTQNEIKGLDLVWRALNIIQLKKPRYWVLENVPGLADFIGEPVAEIRYGLNVASKRAALWGVFPPLGLLETMIDHKRLGVNVRSPTRRAAIPRPVSILIAKAIKDDLVNSLDVDAR